MVGPTGTASGRLLFVGIAVGHSFTNINQTFDETGPGSAGISWTISGVKTRSGQPFALARANRWTSSEDIAFEATDELFVALSSSRPRTSNRSSHRARGRRRPRSSGRFVATGLKGSCGRATPAVSPMWKGFGCVAATPSARESSLRALDDGSLRTERMSFRVPGGRRRGVIQIAGGAALAAEEEAEAEVVGEEGEGKAEPDSLDALLADLVSAPRTTP